MKFIIDVSDLGPGDSLQQSECERTIGFPMASDRYAYSFALMQLVDYVQKLLWKDGRQYTVISDGGTIRVLSHEEASKYNASRFENAIGKMRRCHRRLLAVDCGTFSQETRDDHISAIVKTSRIVTLIKSSRTNCELEPHATTTPKRVVAVAK